MLLQQLVLLIGILAVHPLAASVSVSATASPQSISAVQTASASLQPSPSQTPNGLASQAPHLDSTAAMSLGTSAPVMTPPLGTSGPVVTPSLDISAPVVTPSLVTSASVVAPSLGTSNPIVAQSLGTSAPVMTPSLGTSAPVVTPSLGTSAPVVTPSLGTSAAVMSLGASAPVVTPSLGTSAPVVTPSLGTLAPIMSLGASAPVVTTSLGTSAPVVSLGTSAPVVAPSLSTSAPVVAPSLGTSAPVVAPSLGTSAPIVATSLGTSTPVVAPSLGTLGPAMTPSLGISSATIVPYLSTLSPTRGISPSLSTQGHVPSPRPSLLAITPSPGIMTSIITPVMGTQTPVIANSLGTPTPTVTPSLRTSEPLARPSSSTATQAPSITSSLEAFRSAGFSTASATHSTPQLNTVRLNTSQMTVMQTSTVLISPSVARSMSSVTATVTANTTAPTSPPRQVPVLQAQSFDVISRSSDVFSPVEGTTVVFNYIIRNTGPVDLPPSRGGTLQIKVYLTDSAQFDAATLVSKPTDATVSPLHTVLIRHGLKTGDVVELSDLSAKVSVPGANCSSYTHLCVALEIHGTAVNQTTTGVCKPLGSGQGGVGAQDCSKVLGTCSVTCDANANCIRADDGKASCACASGYTGDGTVCWDEDECRSAPCADVSNSRCVNTVGSYHCACVPGYVKTGGACRAVMSFQADVRFFAYNYTDAYSNRSSAEYRQLADIYLTEMTSLYLASPLATVFRSVEVLGFRKGSVIGTHAVNVAEGSGQTASAVSTTLQNAIQSAGGTTLQMSSEVTVTDYDECASPDSHDCSPDARCENQVGGFTCVCRTGYQDRSPQDRPGRKCYNSTLVAGVTLGLVALALLIIVLAVCCCRKRKKAEPVGVGDLVWGKQSVRAFWWPGEVVPGRNGNSLWVRWFGLNTFSPVSELKVQKFQSLEQHYDSEANETMQSYREGLNRIMEKKNSQRRDMYEMISGNEVSALREIVSLGLRKI
ncbi:flocculation protein FLO11-like [Branchiostoma floridae]|uniref:Flocculation protein FLO11-like n=1 Tax=Branchiostoma floridae TaxID=7739 RepID=A0A9J7MYX1_BRAFL|nr:flocculation protein FLO11-like [Branchiostoma floridae]